MGLVLRNILSIIVASNYIFSAYDQFILYSKCWGGFNNFNCIVYQTCRDFQESCHVHLSYMNLWFMNKCIVTDKLYKNKSNTMTGMEKWWSSLYHTFVLITQYILPVIIMAYCYSMMALTIWRNKDLVNAEVSYPR